MNLVPLMQYVYASCSAVVVLFRLLCLIVFLFVTLQVGKMHRIEASILCAVLLFSFCPVVLKPMVYDGYE